MKPLNTRDEWVKKVEKAGRTLRSGQLRVLNINYSIKKPAGTPLILMQLLDRDGGGKLWEIFWPGCEYPYDSVQVWWLLMNTSATVPLYTI